jgi:phage shock protein A
MENQLLQVKTQVAISIADQHMLEKKQKENDVKAAEWMRKAELAVDRGQDDLARAALERHKSCERTAESFREQVADQLAQVEMLKSVLGKWNRSWRKPTRRAPCCWLNIAVHGRSAEPATRGRPSAAAPPSARSTG